MGAVVDTGLLDGVGFQVNTMNALPMASDVTHMNRNGPQVRMEMGANIDMGTVMNHGMGGMAIDMDLNRGMNRAMGIGVQVLSGIDASSHGPGGYNM